MLNKIKNRKQEGFTIIEVLIVLAIAGLIMLIVFLAVPALQRNSRNTQRQADASKLSTSVANCMSARNGKNTSCNTQALLETNGGLEVGKMQQIETITDTATDPAASVYNIASFGFGKKCEADGGSAITGETRQAVVLIRQENGTTGTIRCIDV